MAGGPLIQAAGCDGFGYCARVSPSKLTALERQVLGALIMKRDARVVDRTVESVATLTGLQEADVRQTLEQLDSLQPRLVHRTVDAVLNIEFWTALQPAMEEL